MTSINLALVLVSGIWGVATIIALRTPRLWAVSFSVLAVTLAVIQLTTEGFYWHFLPVYALIGLCSAFSLPAASWISSRGILTRLVVRLGLLTVLGVLGLCWVFVPVPQLPTPSGPHPVGTEIFRWVDKARLEVATETPGDFRNVVVQAWYPAELEPGGLRLPYIDGLGRLPDMVSIIPSFFMSYYGQIDTHASPGAPVSSAESSWPVVLFSPGYGAPRAGYTTLLTNLASYGYVVLALDHPYEAAVVELADGTIATPVPVARSVDPAAELYMANQQSKRADDLAFVLAEISRSGVLGDNLEGHLALDRVAAIGHSFGGAAATELLTRNVGLSAAVNIDGTPYGALLSARLQHPFMLVQSDAAETGHSPQFVQGNGSLIANSAALAVSHELERTNHYSFTDVPLYLSPPAGAALAVLIGGSRGTSETVKMTTNLLVDFLAQSLGERVEPQSSPD